MLTLPKSSDITASPFSLSRALLLCVFLSCFAYSFPAYAQYNGGGWVQ